MKQHQKVLPDGKFELDFDIDVDLEREELQMPELSQGKYLHDFKVRRGVLTCIKSEVLRCNVTISYIYLN